MYHSPHRFVKRIALKYYNYHVKSVQYYNMYNFPRFFRTIYSSAIPTLFRFRLYPDSVVFSVYNPKET